MSKNWASTLRLPKSTFPDGYIRRCADDFYRWQAANRPAEEGHDDDNDNDNEFVLHDGPPYANGSLHAGHALNKILKDMILRVKVQQGRRVRYVPGWDCHGLPIELKALASSTTDSNGNGNSNTARETMTAMQVRGAARALASRTVAEQMRSFRSYGVMADWDARWTTMDPGFETRQLRLFQRMARRGLIYRRYRPVYWSPSSGTALAEAELEYSEEHVSRVAYVRFPISLPRGGDDLFKNCPAELYAVIWTTTPWTLPANKAIAVHEDMAYAIVKVGGAGYVVAESCLPRVAQTLWGISDAADLEVVASVRGSQLMGLQYVNKLQGKAATPQPVIHGSFVTADSGSGLVHCAPGHGAEDYLACSALGIPVTAPVDKNGLFTADAYPDDPAVLEGVSVLDGGSARVLALLGADVLDAHDYKHKYPYDWRTKRPIIVRATAQWFADVASIKDAALGALADGGVQFVPRSGRSRLEAFVSGRSEWCISRQRAWGVPIPALYDANGDAVMTDETIEHIVSVIEQRGTDAWWSDDPHDPAWIPASLREKAGASSDTYTRGTDTMDVWFDSGSSWTQTDGQADVYLEGSDQHRGWFQSSLLTRVAAMVSSGEVSSSSGTTGLGLSPFKTLITHGFTLDKDGKKMSKSLGNIISADQVMDGSLLPPLKTKKNKNKNSNDSSNAAAPAVVRDALGPDALRLWVASSDYTRDIVLGEPVLKAVHQSLVKYRAIVKMLTGSLRESARTSAVTTADVIALVQLRDAMAEVGRCYDAHEFYRAFGALNRWVVNDLSAFYLEALKDRLYCGDGGGVVEPVLMGLLRMLAPVTPLLVEEAWDHCPAWLKDDPSVLHPLHQLYTAPLLDASRVTANESELREAIPVLTATHAAIKAASEPARAAKVLGSSLQCSVNLQVPRGSRALELLEKYRDELDAMFVVSAVSLNEDLGVETPEWAYSAAFEVPGSSEKCTAWVLPPKQHKCPRCWRYVAPVEDALCGRCEGVVSAL